MSIPGTIFRRDKSGKEIPGSRQTVAEHQAELRRTDPIAAHYMSGGSKETAPKVPKATTQAPGKEYVFEFSKPIKINSTITSLISKVVQLLGGKRSYIEDGNKLVVVM